MTNGTNCKFHSISLKKTQFSTKSNTFMRVCLDQKIRLVDFSKKKCLSVQVFKKKLLDKCLYFVPYKQRVLNSMVLFYLFKNYLYYQDSFSFRLSDGSANSNKQIFSINIQNVKRGQVRVENNGLQIQQGEKVVKIILITFAICLKLLNIISMYLKKSLLYQSSVTNYKCNIKFFVKRDFLFILLQITYFFTF